MLIFPAEAADSGCAGSFDNGNVKDLAADFVVVFLALLFGELNKSLIRDGFHEAIAQKIQRNAEGTNVLGIRNVLLNLGAGERGVGADRAVVHEIAAFNDLAAVIDRNLRILKLAIGPSTPNAQFTDLAGSSRSAILVARST